MRRWLCGLVILAAAVPSPGTQDKRTPVPSAEELKKATSSIRELFKMDFGWDLGSLDPNPGQVKTTVVVSELHGRRFVRALRQGEIAPMVIR